MNKHLKKLNTLISTSFILAFSLNAYAEEPTEALPADQQVMIVSPEISWEANPIKADVPEDILKNPKAPAPPLSEMWVYSVESSNCDTEYTVGKITTDCDHGGAKLRAYVLEIGYGSNSTASMNGTLLPSSALYERKTVCAANGYYYWPCNAGQTILGWFLQYNLDGYQTGTFRYQNISTNAPWNTMSTQINIR